MQSLPISTGDQAQKCHEVHKLLQENLIMALPLYLDHIVREKQVNEMQ